MNKPKETISEIADDAKEVQINIRKGDSQESSKSLRYFVSRHKGKIFLSVVGIGMVISSGFVDFQIPEWVTLIGVSALIGAFVCYPYARYVAKLYIQDTRKPVVEISPTDLTDIAVWNVPEQEIPNIEVIDGKGEDITTKRGVGKCYEELEVTENEGGIVSIRAKGTWVGSKSGLELKKDESSIESMKENLEPLARKGLAYDMKWPMIVHGLSSRITNSLIYEFQGGVSYKGKEMYEHIQTVISDYKPEEMNEEMDEVVSDEGIEEMDIDKQSVETMANIANGEADD